MPIDNRDWYREEWRKRHKEDNSMYCPEQERCPKCGKIFPNEDALIHHAVSEHRQKGVQNDKKKQLPWYKRLLAMLKFGFRNKGS